VSTARANSEVSVQPESDDRSARDKDRTSGGKCDVVLQAGEVSCKKGTVAEPSKLMRV